MEKYLTTLKGIGLQLFADGGEGGSGEGGTQQSQQNQQQGAQNNQQQNNQQQNQNQQGTQYTQEQLNTMMANEKRTARQAFLKALGIELKEGEKYEDAIKRVKTTLDAGKTQAQLDAEAKKAAETARDEANAKASRLEMQVAALKAGVNPDSVEDVITLALGKVNDNTTIEQVLTSLKEKYPTFFGEEKGSSGTGGSTNPKRKQSAGAEGLGQRLAKAHKTSVKSSYFTK